MGERKQQLCPKRWISVPVLTLKAPYVKLALPDKSKVCRFRDQTMEGGRLPLSMLSFRTRSWEGQIRSICFHHRLTVTDDLWYGPPPPLQALGAPHTHNAGQRGEPHGNGSVESIAVHTQPEELGHQAQARGYRPSENIGGQVQTAERQLREEVRDTAGELVRAEIQAAEEKGCGARAQQGKPSRAPLCYGYSSSPEGISMSGRLPVKRLFPAICIVNP